MEKQQYYNKDLSSECDVEKVKIRKKNRMSKISEMVNFVLFVGQLYLSADGFSWLSLTLPWEPPMKEFCSLFKLDPASSLFDSRGETLSGRSKLGIRHRQDHNSLTYSSHSSPKNDTKKLTIH